MFEVPAPRALEISPDEEILERSGPPARALRMGARLALALLLLFVGTPAWADCLDTASNDCDGDGFAQTEGDCDDEDPAIYPGADDGCDGIDNNCNGTIDEDCDEPLRDATIGGGSTCDSVGGAPRWLLALPLLLIGRRRT